MKLDDKTAVLFDLDGTVLDTLGDLTDSLNFVLTENGLPTHTKEEICGYIGDGVRKLVERALPCGISAQLADKALEEFRMHYSQHLKVKTAPYAGIVELMRELSGRGCRLAIVSNKPDYAVQILSKEFFDGLIVFAAGESSEYPRKPSPECIYSALKRLGCDREYAIYVGDSEIDVQTAQNAGIRCVSVTWGFRKKDYLLAHGAVNPIDSPEEFLPLFD